MKHIAFLFLLLVIITSCQRNELQTISKEVLSKELTEVQADSGLVILIKDNEIAAKVNLISDNGIYKEGDEQSFQTKRDMGTLLSTACMMAALDCISPTDTVDVGAGIYLKDGKEVRDHNADKGGYGVLTAEQVIAYDSKIGIMKIMERCDQVKDNLSKMGFSSLHVSPMETAIFYNRIANEDTTLCSEKIMNEIWDMLFKVILEGTGKSIFLEDVPLAGKTGYSEQDGKKEVSCCIFFNVDGSLYTCLVIISNPKQGYPSGGVMAGDVVKGIIKSLKSEENEKEN